MRKNNSFNSISTSGSSTVISSNTARALKYGSSSSTSPTKKRVTFNNKSTRSGSGVGSGKGKKKKLTLALFAIVALLMPFIICETFLTVLVLLFKDAVVPVIATAATSSSVVGNVMMMDSKEEVPVDYDSMPDVRSDAEVIVNQSVYYYDEEELIGEVEEKDLLAGNNDEDLLTEVTETLIINKDAKEATQMSSSATENTSPNPAANYAINEHDDINNNNNNSQEIYRSMLEYAFAKLRGESIDGKSITNRKSVESLCGDTWMISNDILLNESLEEARMSSDATCTVGSMEEEDGGGGQLLSSSYDLSSSSSSSSSNSWKTLALDAQRCLGAAGLAFITTQSNINHDRLSVSTKIFDRLSYIDPTDLDVRAGLGTALLIQGIFGSSSRDSHHDDADDEQRDKSIESRIRSLSLAAYHLKVASSLCTTSSNVNNHHRGETDPDDDDMTPTAIPTRHKLHDVNAVSHAAILHNLALAYLAVGDRKNAVPVLLQAAAIGRELHSLDTKPYWNVPNEILMAMEERALLFSARPNIKEDEEVEESNEEEKKRKRRMPFMPLLESRH